MDDSADGSSGCGKSNVSDRVTAVTEGQGVSASRYISGSTTVGIVIGRVRRSSSKWLGGQHGASLIRYVGAAMGEYSIIILICSTALSRADCQPGSAIDLVRGPRVGNAVMCSLNAQTIMARTDLVGEGGSQYMKVVCAHSEGADRWRTEIEAREAAMLR